MGARSRSDGREHVAMFGWGICETLRHRGHRGNEQFDPEEMDEEREMETAQAP